MKKPWKDKRNKYQLVLTESAPWKRRRTSGDACLIKGYSVSRPHQTQNSSLKSYISMKKTLGKEKRRKFLQELTENATGNPSKRRTSGDTSHNSSLEYDSRKKKHNRSKSKRELTENSTGIPSRKKKKSVINGYSVSPTDSMLYLISKISSWQKKHGMMLKRMEEGLVKVLQEMNRMRNNQYTFEAPIANLQICGDGRNQMNIKKEQPATKVDSPYPPLYQDLPIPLPTPVPACLPLLNPNKVGFLSGKFSTLVLARPEKHSADGSMLLHEVPALLSAMSPAQSPETEVLGRVAPELKDQPPPSKSMGSAQAQPVACFQPALMPELPCKPHCTDPSTFSRPAPRPKTDADVADEEEDCVKFDASEKSSTREITPKAHLGEEQDVESEYFVESEGLYTPYSDTDFDSDSEYGSIDESVECVHDQIDPVSDSEFNVSDIDEGGFVSGPFSKPALKKRKKKWFNSGETNNLRSKVPYTENILTGFGPRVAATNQKGDFRIGLSGTCEADGIESVFSVTHTGRAPDVKSGMSPADTGQTSENQPVLTAHDTANAGRAPDVESGMSPADTGQAHEVQSDMSPANTARVPENQPVLSAADTASTGRAPDVKSGMSAVLSGAGTGQGGDVSPGVSVADRVQADDTDSGGCAKDTHQKGGNESCVSLADTGQTDGSRPGANTGLTRLVGFDAETDSGGEGIDCDSDVSAGDTNMKGSDTGQTDGTQAAISAIDTDPGGGRESVDDICLAGDEGSAVSASDTGQPLCIDSYSQNLQGSKFGVKVGDISSQKNPSAVDLSEFVTSQNESTGTAVPMSVRSRKGKTGADMSPSPTSTRVVHTDEDMSVFTTSQKGNAGTDVFAKIKLKNAGADVSAFGTSQKAGSMANVPQRANGLVVRSESIFCMSIGKGQIHFLEEGAEEKKVIWPTGIVKETGAWDWSPEDSESDGEIPLEGGVSGAEEGTGGTFSSAEEPHAIENGGVPPATQTLEGIADACQFSVTVSTDVSSPTTAKVPGPTHGQSTVEVNPISDSLIGLGSDSRQLPVVHSVGDLIFKCPTSFPFAFSG